MDIIKKTLQFGVGVFAISMEQLDLLAKDLKKKYQLDDKTSKKIAKEIISNSISTQKKIREMVEAHIEDVFADYGIKSKKKKSKSRTKKSSSRKSGSRKKRRK